MGVIVNRAGIGDDRVYRFCREVDLPMLAEIPYDRAIAEAYASGKIVAESNDRWGRLFAELTGTIRRTAQQASEFHHA
jgi:MinD superfamily P-loop ATPase